MQGRGAAPDGSWIGIGPGVHGPLFIDLRRRIFHAANDPIAILIYVIAAIMATAGVLLVIASAG